MHANIFFVIGITVFHMITGVPRHMIPFKSGPMIMQYKESNIKTYFYYHAKLPL